MTTEMTENTATADETTCTITNLGEYLEAVKQLRKRQKAAEQFGRKIDAAEAKYADVKSKIEALNQRRAAAMLSSLRSPRSSLPAHEEHEFRSEEANILDVEHDIDFEEGMIPALKAQHAAEMEAIAHERRELRKTGRHLAIEKFETDADELVERIESLDTTKLDAVSCVEQLRDICEASNQFYNYPGRFALRTVLEDTVVNGEKTKMPVNARFVPGLLSEKVDLKHHILCATVVDPGLSETPDSNQVDVLVAEMRDMFLVPLYSHRERDLEWRSYESPAKKVRNEKYLNGFDYGRNDFYIAQEIAALEEAREQLKHLQSQPF